MNSSMILLAWDKDLAITIRNGGNALFMMDFNRFRYIGVPQTKAIMNNEAMKAKRDITALNLHRLITQAESIADATKVTLFNTARLHIQWCDKYNLVPFTQDSVINELQNNHERQRRGQIKDSTETLKRANLSSLLKLLDFPVHRWLSDIIKSGATQCEHTKSYSSRDLNKLLPFLRGLFKQLYRQLILNPNNYIGKNSRAATMTFIWEGNIYHIRSRITKIIFAATYLLSYYTWSNSSVIYNLKRPNIVNHTLKDNWYKMPAFKRRAFKTITIEIGDHDRIEIPKYALQFFDQLLEISRLIDPSPNALLLNCIADGEIIPVSTSILTNVKRIWLIKNFPMFDDMKQVLTPVVMRFRTTGGELSLANRGSIESSILLHNTPNVVKTSYSTGNHFENNQMLRETALILEKQVQYRQGIDAAKQAARESLKVEILTYEAYLKRSAPLNRSANGSYCNDTSSHMANLYTKHAQQHALLSEGERLACADLLSCFSCEHQVLVEEVDDIWCLLSFRECLEESQYLHLDKRHYHKNFNRILTDIDSQLKKIDQKILRRAQRKLADSGYHPLWPDSTSIGIL
ncbi:TPA: hypothetical protein ACGSUL_002033 [Yersinia enterocolitica]